MPGDDITRVAGQARAKWRMLEASLSRYLLLSSMAGIYVGFGIALIFSLGGPLAGAGSPWLKPVMGAAFGIALTLVIFAGSELFTGNNMVGTVGGLSGSVTWPQAIQLNVVSWAGNLLGSLGLAWLVVHAGVFANGEAAQLISTVASAKMAAPAWELFLRGVLCNWLICLAVWTAGRTTSETAKLLLIFWCLLAFIGTGYEHSIANQSLLGMALLLPHGPGVEWLGFWYNQLFVVLGNLVGGGICVGGVYWFVTPHREGIPAASSSPGAVTASARP